METIKISSDGNTRIVLGQMTDGSPDYRVTTHFGDYSERKKVTFAVAHKKDAEALYAAIEKHVAWTEVESAT